METGRASDAKCYARKWQVDYWVPRNERDRPFSTVILKRRCKSLTADSLLGP
jgi:hypothetical protein